MLLKLYSETNITFLVSFIQQLIYLQIMTGKVAKQLARTSLPLMRYIFFYKRRMKNSLYFMLKAHVVLKMFNLGC